MGNKKAYHVDGRKKRGGVMQQRLAAPHLVDGRAMREEQFDELRASRSIGFAVCDCQAQWRISFIRSC